MAYFIITDIYEKRKNLKTLSEVFRILSIYKWNKNSLNLQIMNLKIVTTQWVVDQTTTIISSHLRKKQSAEQTSHGTRVAARLPGRRPSRAVSVQTGSTDRTWL